MHRVFLHGLAAISLVVSGAMLPGCDAPEDAEVEEEQLEDEDEDD